MLQAQEGVKYKKTPGIERRAQGRPILRSLAIWRSPKVLPALINQRQGWNAEQGI